MNASYRQGPPPGKSATTFVARAYDQLAARYNRQRRLGRWPLKGTVMNRFIDRLPRRARVVDLGCGAGYPVARFLSDRGFQVTGIDVSRRMLALARRAVPGGTFLRRDMAAPGLAAHKFDGAIAMYSFFHVPWRRHPMVLRSVRRILAPGGVFLFNLGDGIDMEYTESFMGTRMYWSSPPVSETLRTIRSAGLRTLWHNTVIVGGERHHYYLVRSPLGARLS